MAATADRRAPAGWSRLAAAPPRCPACAVPRWRRCVFRVCVCVCCSSVRAGDQTRAPASHRSRCDVRLGSRHTPSRADIVPRPQNPAGPAWRIVKVQDPKVVRPVGRETHRSSRSSNLVRSRSPTSHEASQPAAGGLVTAAGMLAQRRASSAPGWSRGDSNPGPPPCKGGALPAKLRPPELLRPCPHRNGVGAPGLEPGTSALSGPRSHHLSYAPRDSALFASSTAAVSARVPPGGQPPHAQDGARVPTRVTRPRTISLPGRRGSTQQLPSVRTHVAPPTSPTALAPLPGPTTV